MKIEIIGTETLGVRGLCCFVETTNRRILIDPGIALGYTRFGMLPHPFQVSVDEEIQEQIVRRWTGATDIVISHFHGDHTPLADANPFQLHTDSIKDGNPGVKIWAKHPDHFSPRERKRFVALSSILEKDFLDAEGKSDGMVEFSHPVSHGDRNMRSIKVLMTRIAEDKVFVHASDNQLLDDEALSCILDWKPDVVFTGGPPLYLSRKLTGFQVEKAWNNARTLAREVDTLILDHHLMRNFEGLAWIRRLSAEFGKKVYCGADFMNKPRMLLEADRRRLYRMMPVPKGWHDQYARGRVNTGEYRRKGKRYLNFHQKSRDHNHRKKPGSP